MSNINLAADIPTQEWQARQKFAGLRQTLDRIAGAIYALENHAVDSSQVDTRLLKSDLQNAIAHSRDLTAKMVKFRNALPVTGGPGRKKQEAPAANGSEPVASTTA